MDFLLKGGRTKGRGSQGLTKFMTAIDIIPLTTDPICSVIISPIVMSIRQGLVGKANVIRTDYLLWST
jgi:hypothetical protein